MKFLVKASLVFRRYAEYEIEAESATDAETVLLNDADRDPDLLDQLEYDQTEVLETVPGLRG